MVPRGQGCEQQTNAQCWCCSTAAQQCLPMSQVQVPHHLLSVMLRTEKFLSFLHRRPTLLLLRSLLTLPARAANDKTE